MNPIDLADYAISRIPDHIFAEFKYLKSNNQNIYTRNEQVINISNPEQSGFGIRVLVDGSWGFYASDTLTTDNIDFAINKAIRLAKIASQVSPHIKLSEEPVIEDRVTNKYKIDPFNIPVNEKVELLIDAAKIANKYPEIKYTTGIYFASRDNMIFFNTEGTKIQQEISWNGGIMTMIAQGNSDTQTRKFPDDHFATRGYEYFIEQNIPARIDEEAKELVKLLEAPKMKSGNADIILAPSQLGLQLHESCGHPSELDRSLGYEAAYAGTSFLRKEMLNNKYMYGNEQVSIHADATIEGGLGSFYYDHEGVSAKNTPLVTNGEFVGFLTSRETAPLIGLENSGGTARSISYDKIPLIRMTNIVLQPGDWDFDELIADTKDGYYLVTNRSWSIDDLRYNFQFGTELGYKIENGEIKGLVRNPTYTGITNEFWNSVNGVCKKDFSEVLGTPSCGKGEPGQSMYTGHGGPPTRFENVRVGVI